MRLEINDMQQCCNHQPEHICASIVPIFKSGLKKGSIKVNNAKGKIKMVTKGTIMILFIMVNKLIS